MVIKDNMLYVNRTWRYLIPCFKVYGDEFIYRFNVLYKIGAGLWDVNFNKETFPNLKDKNPIFILFDKTKDPAYFEDCLSYFSSFDYFIFDYCPVSASDKIDLHMIVFKTPSIFQSAYKHFLKGEYSLMYPKETIENIFGIKERIIESNVLSGSNSATEYYFDVIKKEFKLLPTENLETIKEYDIPPTKGDEVFFIESSNRDFLFSNF